MSGGMLDYVFSKVQYAIYELEHCITNVEYPITNKEQVDYYIKFKEHLQKVAQALHDVEWELSGDTSWPSSLQSIRDVLNDGDK